MRLAAGMQPVVDWVWTYAGKALGYGNADALFSYEKHRLADPKVMRSTAVKETIWAKLDATAASLRT
jgi:hypothetical protein